MAEGVKHLAEGIKYLGKLSNLSLSIDQCNDIKSEGAKILAKNISKYTNMTYLKLVIKGNNGLNPQNIKYFKK